MTRARLRLLAWVRRAWGITSWQDWMFFALTLGGNVWTGTTVLYAPTPALVHYGEYWCPANLAWAVGELSIRPRPLKLSACLSVVGALLWAIVIVRGIHEGVALPA